MYLKSVELYGFKSFAGKMIFKFHNGITGIVGPNGSGKSNIADAIRWVLGEQSAKQLRGSKMQDIIFSGTENKRPQSYCYVELTIDNHDKKLAIDYTEVTVGRRVYRSGESEYTINKAPCRLKDIQQLFLDTGVGKEGYSIIGQGQIDRILSAKPEDRRLLFDEAAGIVKYRYRKENAEKKLESGQKDLERISDVIRELERQKTILEKQTEKAKVYLHLRDGLKKYEINQFIRLIDSYEQTLDDLTELKKACLTELKAKQNEHQSMLSKYQIISQQVDDLECEIDELMAESTNHRLDSEKIKGDIRLTKEQLGHLHVEAERLQQLVETDKSESLDLEKKLTELDYQTTNIQQELVKDESEMTEQEEIRHSLAEEVANHEKQLQSIQKNVLQKADLKSTIQSKLERFDAQIIAKQERFHAIDDQLSEKQTTIDHLATQSAYLEQERQQLEVQTKNLSDSLVISKKDLTLKKEQRQAANQTLQTLQSDLMAKQHQVDFFVKLESNYEGYFDSVRQLMKWRPTGLIDVVSNLLQVDSKYEKAIETALGNQLQYLVTQTDQVAQSCIAYLKEHRYGRATFLPLNVIHPKSLPKISNDQGCLGTAIDLIRYEPAYQSIFSHLLANTIVADTLTNARRIAKRYHYKYKVVTLDGEIIYSGGSMTGGQFKKEKPLLLSRKNDVVRLQAEVEALQADCQQQIIFLKKQQSIYENLKKQVVEQTESLKEQELLAYKLKTKHHQATLEWQRLTNEFVALNEEKMTLTLGIEELTEQKESESKSLISHELDSNKAKADVTSLTDKISLLKSDFDNLHIDIVNKKMAIASKNEQLRHHQEERQRLTDNLAAKDQHLESIRHDLQKANLERLKKEQAESVLLEKEILLAAQIEEETAQLKVKRFDKQSLQVTKGQLEVKKETIHDQLTALQKEEGRLGLAIEKIDYQKESQINYIWDEYELTYSKALELRDDDLGSDTLIKKAIKDYKQEMQALGDVNVGAITEFREVSKRYDFLNGQKEDLLESIDKLYTIINDLTDKISRQFRTEFSKINQQFSQVFKDLFGGGKAYLELTDANQILNSGIVIHAQPPGKRLQNMLLLSGGEKAFTAIALLFAIQQLRPSPFCVLDEIEAALDDSNVDRFADYLHDLSKETQFIIITHRKGTMEAADQLYGITMQEKGISTQVSVSFIEEELEKK